MAPTARAHISSAHAPGPFPTLILIPPQGLPVFIPDFQSLPLVFDLAGENQGLVITGDFKKSSDQRYLGVAPVPCRELLPSIVAQWVSSLPFSSAF